MARRGFSIAWDRAKKQIYIALALFVGLLAILSVFTEELAGLFSDDWVLGTVQGLNSLLVSLFSALIFFLVIGVTSLIVGLRNPQDDAIESRVEYLFSGSHISSDAKEYLKSQVTKLSAYCRSVEVKLTLEEFDADAAAFRISVDAQQFLQSCIHDEAYVDEDVCLDVEADPIEGKDPLGEVYCEELYVEGEPKAKWRDLSRKTLTRENLYYREPRKLEVAADSMARYGNQHWIWCAADEGYLYTTRRYTEEFSVSLRNKSGIPIIAGVRIARQSTLQDESPEEHNLADNEEKEVVRSGTVSPNVVFWLQIKSSEATEVAETCDPSA